MPVNRADVYFGYFFLFDRKICKNGIFKWNLDVLSELDISRVNEIGEACVIQFIFQEAYEEKQMNFRILASAPTPYQAQEIIWSLVQPFKDLKFSEAKNGDFAKRVASREFSDKEAIVWKC